MDIMPAAEYAVASLCFVLPTVQQLLFTCTDVAVHLYEEGCSWAQCVSDGHQHVQPDADLQLLPLVAAFVLLEEHKADQVQQRAENKKKEISPKIHVD